jgi:hypothetical protein
LCGAGALLAVLAGAGAGQVGDDRLEDAAPLGVRVPMGLLPLASILPIHGVARAHVPSSGQTEAELDGLDARG